MTLSRNPSGWLKLKSKSLKTMLPNGFSSNLCGILKLNMYLTDLGIRSRTGSSSWSRLRKRDRRLTRARRRNRSGYVWLIMIKCRVEWMPSMIRGRGIFWVGLEWSLGMRWRRRMRWFWRRGMSWSIRVLKDWLVCRGDFEIWDCYLEFSFSGSLFFLMVSLCSWV